jgi:two-component system, chemotaxis family, chemotaxis protein CheY
MIMPLQPSPPPSEASQSQRRLVLVVDDSATIRQEVAAALEPQGFTVLAAADGLDGLVMLGEHAVSLVLLDVSMPRLGGLEMLERMKNDPALAKLPVLMLTAEAQESEIERARRLGAKGWMIKPIRPQQLVSIANKLCLEP